MNHSSLDWFRCIAVRMGLPLVIAEHVVIDLSQLSRQVARLQHDT